MSEISLTIKGGTPFGDLLLLQRQIAAHRALVPGLREVLDGLDHAPDCPALRDEGTGCSCGCELGRATLARAIRVLEGEGDA